ncbi:MAG: hydrogenase formation protein HypD [Actinobacteria bacterium]|nr:hydrogenase formation protein HypD [Actinomycetota bacterium]
MPLPFLDEFRRSEHVHALMDKLEERAGRLDGPVRIMEVCGTHTMAISRHGIRQALPENLRLISGPGCPVCVTANTDIDAFIEMSLIPGVIVATFGDMLKVPGTRLGLTQARSLGAKVQVVYSTLDALQLARDNPASTVVFFGIGFETTAPTVAAAILEARETGLDNFMVLSAHKVVPPALAALCSTPELAVDAFLCPGHVTAIIGPEAYAPVARDFNVPCVIAGFEPADILQSLAMLCDQVADGRTEVELQYKRGVRPGGNPAAMSMIDRVFEPCDADWRGLGTIPGSGLAIRKDFADHDAALHFEVDVSYSREPRGCLCGAILTGQKFPGDCPLFGKLCSPDHPVGPCMVSSEGTCAAYFQYEI